VVGEILNFVSMQLRIPPKTIEGYAQRRQTIDAHRERIRQYLGIRRFDDAQLPNPKEWLSRNMRVIKLSNLLLEVDNELKITRHFISVSRQEDPQAKEICTILATTMAHGCNIGPYAMSHLTGISYRRIKHITDWMLTEEGLQEALALTVNAISNLDITQAWGTGKASSSDGQKFSLKRKVFQQTYSQRFNDFALEFYSFIADNYALICGFPIECTDRDAPYVLDDLLKGEQLHALASRSKLWQKE